METRQLRIYGEMLLYRNRILKVMDSSPLKRPFRLVILGILATVISYSSAGIAIILQEIPIFQELGRAASAKAANMVGIVSIGNALGRGAWASVSNHFGRKTTFSVMFLLQPFCFGSCRLLILRFPNNFRLFHPDVLRGDLKRCLHLQQIFWSGKCRVNLWSDSDRLGKCKCVRAANDCTYA